MKIIMADDDGFFRRTLDIPDVDANVREEIWEQISEVVSEYI